jgi:hypothetical protein
VTRKAAAARYIHRHSSRTRKPSNPAVSGVQYRLAQAVLDGTARSSTMTKKVAQEIVDKTPPKLRSEFSRPSTANPSIYDYEDAFHAGRQRGSQIGSKVSSAAKTSQFNIWWKLEKGDVDPPDKAGNKAAYIRGWKAASNPRAPLNDAAALSESWHGRPAERATDYNEAFRYRGALTDLGRLQEIAVLETDRKAMLIKFDAKTRLASSENGKQLYIVGGDQSLDLGALGIVGEEAEKDLIPIGEVHHIVYVTAKMHLGREDKKRGPYQHELGEESGVMPILMYDRLNKACGFAGGVYNIDATDYDGKHSAGIRD